MDELHFIRPWWFIALVPVIFTIILLWRKHQSGSAWSRLLAPELLDHLLLDENQAARRWPIGLLALAWLLAVLALAGPVWEKQQQPVFQAQADRVIILDMSPSMAGNDVQPNRLSRARLAIRELLASVKEGRSALIVFSNEPYVVSPLTDDVATIETLLPALSIDIMPEQGDKAAPAIRRAMGLLKQVQSTNGSLILISDGVSDVADSLVAINELQQIKIPVSLINVAPTKNVNLQALADAGKGELINLQDGLPKDFLQPVNRAVENKASQQGVERWIERGPWLLLPLLFFAALSFRRGWLGLIVIFFIPTPDAYAVDWHATWNKLWLNKDQQASQLMQQGDSSAASKMFEDSQWRATAQYRAGQYKEAAKTFSEETADGLYNKANALAKAGENAQALKKYDEALAKNPNHEDARFNQALIKKLLQDQKKKQQQKNADQGKKQDSQDQKKGQKKDQQQQKNGQGEKQDSKDQKHNKQQNKQDGQQKSSGGSPDQKNKQSKNNKQQAQSAKKQSDSADKEESAKQAREDVSPQANQEKPKAGRAQEKNKNKADGEGKQAVDKSIKQNTKKSEKDIALEQWLRQVPDDPAGLLRRKFMLEHLRKQQTNE